MKSEIDFLNEYLDDIPDTKTMWYSSISGIIPKYKCDKPRMNRYRLTQLLNKHVESGEPYGDWIITIHKQNSRKTVYEGRYNGNRGSSNN